MQCGDLLPVRGPRDVVGLDVVHAPTGIQFQNRIVVILRAGAAQIDTVHVGVPRADGSGIRDIAGPRLAAEDRQIRLHRLPGNTAHNVDAEAQPQAVDVIGQRPEAAAARRRREPVHRRNQPAILVHGELRAGAVTVGLGVRLGPLDVDDHILPAVLLQVLGHITGVGPHFRLGHGGAVRVPTVPAHRRSGCHVAGRRPSGRHRSGKQGEKYDGRLHRGSSRQR